MSHGAWTELLVPRNPRAIVAASSLLLLLLYYLIFARFFPNDRGLLGHDYGMFLPLLLDGYYWYVANGLLAVDWFTPSFCGGVPRFANPQGIYYSVPQFLAFALDPLASVKLTLLLFAGLGFAGMYALMRRCFGSARPTAFLAAALFMFNGFYAHRMLVGHLANHAFMLVPFIALLVLRPPPSDRPHRGTAVDLVASGLLIAYLFLAGMVNSVVPALLSVVLIALLHLLHTGDGRAARRALVRLCLGGLLAICLTAAKLAASLAYLGHFPRDMYPLPGFALIEEILRIVTFSLFWQPDYLFGGQVLLNSDGYFDRHEYEFGVTVVPLLILLTSFAYIGGARTLMARVREGVSARTMGVLVLVLAVLALPIALNYYSPAWNALLKRIPLVRNSATMLRWFCLYIPFVIVLAAIALERTVELRRYSRWIAIGGVAFTVLANLYTDRSHYHFEGYEWAEIVVAHEATAVAGYPPPITEVAVFFDQDGNFVAPPHRNNLLAEGKSQFLCYESMFGYGLENFPFKTLQPGPMLREREGVLNIKNPACYVFPEENDCSPGDHFTGFQRDAATEFIAFRPYPFRVSALQRFAGYVTQVTLGGLLLFLLGCGVLVAGDAWRALRRKR